MSVIMATTLIVGINTGTDDGKDLRKTDGGYRAVTSQTDWPKVRIHGLDVSIGTGPELL